MGGRRALSAPPRDVLNGTNHAGNQRPRRRQRMEASSARRNACRDRYARGRAHRHTRTDAHEYTGASGNTSTHCTQETRSFLPPIVLSAQLPANASQLAATKYDAASGEAQEEGEGTVASFEGWLRALALALSSRLRGGPRADTKRKATVVRPSTLRCDPGIVVWKAYE